MANKQEVIRMHAENPTFTAADIAERLACSSAYVRATAQRNGLQLPHRKRGRQTDNEAREAKKLLREWLALAKPRPEFLTWAHDKRNHTAA